MSRILPILFNADMVRAILDGRKTVTRRVIKVPEYYPHFYKIHDNADGAITCSKDTLCAGFYKDSQVFYIDGEKHIDAVYYKAPYKPGDILYIRETWGYYEKHWFEADYFMYRADYQQGAKTYEFDGHICDLPKWHPSIHMPKEAARIWLKVTNVNVEQLKDIREEQIVREGINPPHYHGYRTALYGVWVEKLKKHIENEDPQFVFSQLWNSTIQKANLDRYGWEANPWVWVIEFERCEKPKEISACLLS